MLHFSIKYISKKYTMSEKLKKKIKIILVGDTAVGKTTIIKQYISKMFCETTLSTIGSEYNIKEIEINNEKINLQIWDTPGQVRLRTMTKNFIQNSDIAIMVCDITKKDSFDNLNEWFNTFNNIIDVNNIIIGIAANKSDLFEKEEVDLKEIVDYGKTINAKVFSTSAKEFSSIDDMILDLSQDYYDKFMKNNLKKNYGKKLSQKNNQSSSNCC